MWRAVALLALLCSPCAAEPECEVVPAVTGAADSPHSRLIMSAMTWLPEEHPGAAHDYSCGPVLAAPVYLSTYDSINNVTAAEPWGAAVDSATRVASGSLTWCRAALTWRTDLVRVAADVVPCCAGNACSHWNASVNYVEAQM